MLNIEQIKLKATYYNNVAVALTVTGLVVPLISVSSNDMQLIKDCVDWWWGSNRIDQKLATADIAYGVIFCIGVIASVILASLSYKRAQNILSNLSACGETAVAATPEIGSDAKT